MEQQMIQDYTSGMFAACGIPQPDPHPHTVAGVLDRECGDDEVLRTRFVTQRWPLMAQAVAR
jgi:hypothetical protein